MPAPVINKRFTITTTSWTPITVPRSCTQIHLQNEDGTNTVAMRTDPNDSETERSLYALQNFTFGSAMDGAFEPGMVVVYVQASSGIGPVVATYVR